MATLAETHPTLLDLSQRTDPDGKISAVVEILDQMSEILPDMVWEEGNLTTGHMTTVRTGIPLPTWRKMYRGVDPTKSTTTQVTDTTGMLENYGEVDVALANLNNNAAAFRLSEERPVIEGFNQRVASTLFYGNETTEPAAFTGLSPRFNSRDPAVAASADNVIHAGGAGTDNASIWLVVWGPNTCHGIIPKGSKAGLQVTDKGQVTLETAPVGGGRMEIYRTHYRWDVGLSVRDWRYIVRIANIDKSLLSTIYNAGQFATGANLPELMFEAMELVPNLGMGRPAFYMSRAIRTKVRQQLAAATQQSTLTVQDVGGRKVTAFHDIPLRRVDALAADEALVPA